MVQHFIAGAAGADITPSVGVDLTGFGGRSGPSTSVHDDLAARVLYLSDGEQGAFIVSLDIIGLGRDESLALRSRVAEVGGVDAEAVVVACSHTHSGPATHCIRFLGVPDEAYLTQLADAVVDCARQAVAAATPAQMGWGCAAQGVGINRRQQRGRSMQIGVNEDGPVDSGIHVLRVENLAGSPVAHLFCHAAHAVTLGGDSLAISADWPGYARRAIESVAGGQALFLQGCCGNINCHERNTFTAAENQGHAVAEAVLHAVSGALRPEVSLATASELLELPLLPPPSPEQCAQLLANAESARAELLPDANRGHRWMADAHVAWAEELSRLGDGVRTMPYEVQALRVGDGVLVVLPGEVFIEYALQIAAASPFAATTVAAYASDCPSYIPTAAAYAEGGYEVDNAIRYYGTTMPTPDMESRILAATVRLLARLGS